MAANLPARTMVDSWKFQPWVEAKVRTHKESCNFFAE
jgi:hypothetical protein